ncbi:hypothetical protein [Longimicrobium terrae]|uniref:Uncharacterized protein n=1 Tax=Longimicrobium terrae TaxID=1639882 RepID=A0A841GII9_9BACT|nr:hypothetical protein [Longimicrobium terrae]MBB4634659.1 hypothetical protein [Longimicrobium terrae]MBB6068451.1 hypothetical protein [Longimicrobium terrae]NNC32732.1 hypothetical protein [Longimicrobium terrae]
MIRLAPFLAIALGIAIPAIAQPERETSADTTLPAALLAQFRADAAAMEEEASYLDLDSVPVPVLVYDRVDLNGDGREEVFLSGLGRYCGASGNCPLWIYQAQPEGAWRRIHADGGLSANPQAARTNGFADILVPAHSSAAEMYLTEFAFDGEQYVWSGTTLEVRGDSDEDEMIAFQVRSPVPPGPPTISPLRTVTLEPMMVDSARRITLAATYTTCVANTVEEACFPARFILNTPGTASGGRCFTVHIADFADAEDEVRQVGEPVCEQERFGVTTLSPTRPQLESIFNAAAVELRSGALTVRIREYPLQGVQSFLLAMYTVDGREPPSLN